MAVWQVEQGTAHGRGFVGTDPLGILAKFSAWVVKAGIAGGPGWFLHDNQTNIAPINFAPGNVNLTENTITLTHALVTGRALRFSSTGTMFGGLTAGTYYYAIVISGTLIKVALNKVNAYAGTSIDLVTTQGTGTHTMTPADPFIVVTDVPGPVYDDINTGPGGLPPRFIKIGQQDNQAGYIQMQYWMWWDLTTHMGYGVWAGYIIPTYDDADYEYRFRGGVEGIVISTRLGIAWYHSGVLEWEGDSNLVEGTTKIGRLDGAKTEGSGVVIQLHSGEASNFTKDKYYFITDFNLVNKCNYVKCTNVNAPDDQITVETLSDNMQNHAIIASYAHRFIAFGTTNYASEPNFNNISTGTVNAFQTIPYCSGAPGYVFHNQSSYIKGASKWDFLITTLQQMNPDDYNNRAAMRPLEGEFCRANDSSSTYTTGMNRSYGQVKNVYIAYNNSRVRGSDGLTIGAKDYVFLATVSELSYAGNANADVLFLDTEST